MSSLDDSKRFQVFVSSTYLDLREERQAVTSALLESDAFPAGMELFPATDDDAWSLIKRVIDESDYYLLVIAGKYGSIDPGTELSYTEMEYDYATAQGKPVMAFIHENVDALPRAATEVGQAGNDALKAFRTKVKNAKHVKYWSSPEGLAGAVALSFNKFIKTYPAVGWVRANHGASAEVLQDLAKATARVKELEDRLEQTRVSPPPRSAELAQGSETFALPVDVRGAYFRASDGRRVNFAEWIRVEPDWDQVLGILGLKLFDEASTLELKELFQDWLFQEFYFDFDRKSDEILQKEGKSRKKGTNYDRSSCRVDDEDFGTILLQLKALGLIEGGSKKRSVTDTSTYWALTPFGHTRLLEVRAVQRGQKELPVRKAGSQPEDVAKAEAA